MRLIDYLMEAGIIRVQPEAGQREQRLVTLTNLMHIVFPGDLHVGRLTEQIARGSGEFPGVYTAHQDLDDFLRQVSQSRQDIDGVADYYLHMDDARLSAIPASGNPHFSVAYDLQQAGKRQIVFAGNPLDQEMEMVRLTDNGSDTPSLLVTGADPESAPATISSRLVLPVASLSIGESTREPYRLFLTFGLPGQS